VATGRAVDPDTTLVRIGSISKALTALAVTRAAADGRIDMDADITHYVGGVRDFSGSTRPVVVRDLISHSSGFDQIGIGRQVREFERPLAERKALRPSLQQFLQDGNLRRVTPPGVLFRYDTYGITLAGVVLEKATGRTYAEAMQRELFEPLGMHDSFVEAEGPHLDGLAKGYGFLDGRYVAQPYEVYVTTPASSIDATPADMGRLLEALTSDGSNRHGRLFSKSTLQAVLAPDFRPQEHCPGATHGFFEGQIGSTAGDLRPRSVGHSGSMLGFSNQLTLVPEAELGVFIVANRDAEAGGGGVSTIRRIQDLVIERLGAEAPRGGLALQTAAEPGDYSAVAGGYHWGAYCRTCTDAERARGAWTRDEPRVVTAFDRGVRIGADTYLATTTDGVFLRADGQRHVCFGKDALGRVSHFNFSNSPNTFERGS
jgi:CubicO group peptidase (beta-lactamase class C family)